MLADILFHLLFKHRNHLMFVLYQLYYIVTIISEIRVSMIDHAPLIIYKALKKRGET